MLGTRDSAKAICAFYVQTKRPRKDDDPRFTITMQIDLDAALNDPQLADDDDLGEAHVGASIRRGCARPGEHHAGRL